LAYAGAKTQDRKETVVGEAGGTGAAGSGSAGGAGKQGTPHRRHGHPTAANPLVQFVCVFMGVFTVLIVVLFFVAGAPELLPTLLFKAVEHANIPVSAGTMRQVCSQWDLYEVLSFDSRHVASRSATFSE
jgi:hypothetical protein